MPINKILIIEDDEVDTYLAKRVLSENFFAREVIAASSVKEGMDYLSGHKNDFPEIIFLDLNMPRKNGYTCLDELKSNENFNQIPVIIFSTSFDDETAHQLYNKGAHYYICKPSDYDQLRRIIESALQLISSGKTTQPPKEKFLLGGLRMILL